MTEQEVRERYGVQPDAYLPCNALDLRELAALLYAAWRSFECKRTVQPTDEFPPPQFFHIATELCSMKYRNRNFQSPEHILWPETKSYPRPAEEPLQHMAHLTEEERREDEEAAIRRYSHRRSSKPSSSQHGDS